MPSLTTNNQSIPQRFGTFDYAVKTKDENINTHGCWHVLWQITLFFILSVFLWTNFVLALYLMYQDIGTSITLTVIYLAWITNDIICPCFTSWFLLYKMSDIFYKTTDHNKAFFKSVWLITLVFYIVFNGCLFAIVATYDRLDDSYFNYVSLWNNNCQIFDCANLQANTFLAYVYFPFISLLIHCILVIVIYQCTYRYHDHYQTYGKQKKQLQLTHAHESTLKESLLIAKDVENEKNMSDINNNNFQFELQTPQLELGNMNVESETEASILIDETSAAVCYSYRIGSNILGWLTLFFTILSVYGYILYLLSHVNESIIGQDWEYWYYIFLFVNILIKWLLKKVGRRIDQNRIRLQLQLLKQNKNDHFDNNDHCDFSDDVKIFSMEWFIEILLTSIYYWNFRTYVMFWLSYISWKRFLQTIVVHLLSETIETIVKMSQTYHVTSSKFIGYMRSKRIEKLKEFDKNMVSMSNCKDCGFTIWLYYVCKDDSNYKEWQIRHSIDLCFRLSVAIVSGLWQIGNVWLFAKTYYGFGQKEYNTALRYLGISMSIEMGYFAIVYATQKFFHHFSIFEYNVVVWKTYKKWIILSWIASLLFTVAIY